jgi:hypothetical protein
LHKGGLTLRESLANGAKHFTVIFDGTDTNSLCYRTSTDENSSTSGSAYIGGSFPQWQKITRAGKIFTGYTSSDGVNWTSLGSLTNTMNSTLLAGLAVCSRNNGVLDTVVYDNIGVTGLWPALPGTPAPLIGVAGDSLALLTWPASTNSTGYNLKRGSSGGGPFTTIASNFSNLAFTNAGLADGALYFYVVSGTNYFGESTNSSAVAVRPVSQAPPALGASLIANQLQFNWPTDHVGWKLQAQTNQVAAGIGKNWMTIANSSGTNQITLPIGSTNGCVFYRMTYP